MAPLAPGLFSMMTFWPSERLELVGEESGDEIRRPAGREGHHDADDAGGKVLRAGLAAGSQASAASAKHQPQHDRPQAPSIGAGTAFQPPRNFVYPEAYSAPAAGG